MCEKEWTRYKHVTKDYFISKMIGVDAPFCSDYYPRFNFWGLRARLFIFTESLSHFVFNLRSRFFYYFILFYFCPVFKSVSRLVNFHIKDVVSLKCHVVSYNVMSFCIYL